MGGVVKKKYRIYRDPNKTWWVDSIIPGLDTLWVSDYRIHPRSNVVNARGNYSNYLKTFFYVERWDHDLNKWVLMGPAKTWLDAIRLVAYREGQLQQEGRIHHLEPCS